MKVMRKIIEIDEELCDGCGNCVLACAEGAIQIIDGKAKVVADKYCDGLGACIGDCPQDALKIIEREADDFDEEAVEAFLKQQKVQKKEAEPIACGCPSTTISTFPTVNEGSCDCANKPTIQASGGASCLGHWPVQIKLVPAGAPFLKDSNLVIAADCVPVAYPTFHADFLKGNTVMIGCPKFDNAEENVEKLSQVFKVSGIKTITAVIMEVPCCSAMPMIIKKAIEKAGVDIPYKEVMVSYRGEILS
ncbi:MAG: 4Fe-4S binding protein [Desulfobacula sp.]|uniref:ATP-binding protein n=1 Tax=Desulfobacula sp. TaxID=2593537 RepID=UPI0025B98769|nr:4Fe-4S binding protein [Desulfobacula sp.]MCD4720361.1 4Fe-4S binding protein [Desulfobacula sp.]